MLWLKYIATLWQCMAQCCHNWHALILFTLKLVTTKLVIRLQFYFLLVRLSMLCKLLWRRRAWWMCCRLNSCCSVCVCVCVWTCFTSKISGRTCPLITRCPQIHLRCHVTLSLPSPRRKNERGIFAPTYPPVHSHGYDDYIKMKT